MKSKKQASFCFTVATSPSLRHVWPWMKQSQAKNCNISFMRHFLTPAADSQSLVLIQLSDSACMSTGQWHSCYALRIGIGYSIGLCNIRCAFFSPYTQACTLAKERRRENASFSFTSTSFYYFTSSASYFSSPLCKKRIKQLFHS